MDVNLARKLINYFSDMPTITEKEKTLIALIEESLGENNNLSVDRKDLLEWHSWYRQYKGGYYLSEGDKRELIRLNHLVMGACHDVHNKNMLNDL